MSCSWPASPSQETPLALQVFELVPAAFGFEQQTGGWMVGWSGGLWGAWTSLNVYILSQKHVP